MIDRRVLLVTGTAAVIVTGVGWAATRAPKTAQAPWRVANQGFGDPRLDALAYAILAPNPHNMQPWLIRLDEENSFTLHCDPTRLLPETDPPNRQITIGFGCFLETFRQAAAENGYRVEVSEFPEGEPFPTLDERPIATVMLVKDASVSRDPLFGDILLRRTNRLPFDTARDITPAELEAITDVTINSVVASVSQDLALRDVLRTLTVEAWRTEWSTPRTRRESIDVTRIGKKQINATPYGLALSGPMMDALGAAGVLTPEHMDDAETVAYRESLSFYENACSTAMAHAWVTTKTNTRHDQLEAGRALVRMQLAANSRGIAFHPLSQALQEFPEMSAHYKHVHDILGARNGETIQMLVRLGYAKNSPPAPREPLESKILEL